VAFRSVANCAIVPLQDFLGLGSEARMNTPGQPENNWAWRYRSEVLTDELRDRLCHYVAVYGRVPHNSPYFRS
jgi:4-alpha-glucanotransferase